MSATNREATASGPLSGLRVLEFEGIGPGPHASMILADYGADVVVVGRPRPGASKRKSHDFTRRGQTLVEADLKCEIGKGAVMRLVDKADILIDTYRPGTMENLGFGPERIQASNPRVIYARMTGWGQNGPMSQMAGHDINYLSSTGFLRAFSREGQRPLPPLNLLGDYGGGSMFLLVGILAALYERHNSGLGQVIDAAMVDGVSLLGQFIWSLRGTGKWCDTPGTNVLDTGAPYYDVYETADAEYVAVGAIEPQFYAELLLGLGLEDRELPPQHDKSQHDELRDIFADVFKKQTRDEWAQVFSGTNACVTPVLNFEEALKDEHLRARRTFTSVDGIEQPAPAPKFQRTPAEASESARVANTSIELVWIDPK